MTTEFESGNPDVGIAAAALEDGGEAWVRWTPDLAADPDARELLGLVEAFEPLNGFKAAERAGEWLQKQSLGLDGSAKTWLYLNDRVVQGFYALASTSVQLSSGHRKRLRLRRESTATQPASLVAWITRSQQSPKGTGEKLLLHAISTADSVAKVQGNIALVVDAHDAETARMWEDLGFVRAQKGSDGKANSKDCPRMWFALDGSALTS